MTEPKHKTYKLLQSYSTHCFGRLLLIPAGTLCHWWDERNIFVFQAVKGHCAWIDRWPVESWKDYFKPELT